MPQQPISDDICNDIAGLMDLNVGIGISDGDYCHDQQYSNIIGQQTDINVPPSKKSRNWIIVVDEDRNTTTNDDDSLFKVQSDDSSDKDSIVEHHATDEIPQRSKR